MPTLIDTIRIRTDLGTQPRVAMNDEIVKEYSESMERGEKFPAIEVIYDEANDYFILVDGFHRLAAHKMVFPNNQMFAEIKLGTVDDATWDCLAVNQSHGLRRTNDDKRNAVERALLHPTGKDSTDRVISTHVGVGNEMVSRIRREMVSSGVLCESHNRIGADGKTYNAAKNKKYRAETIKLTGSGFMVVKNPPPEWARCTNCRYFQIEPDEYGERVGIGWCEAEEEERNYDDPPCEDWAIHVPDEPVITYDGPPEKAPDDFVPYEAPSIRGKVGPYEKTRGAVRILFHLKNPELAACELRNTCDLAYMTAVWAAYKKLVNDRE